MRLYFKYLSVNIKSQLQHKGSFILLTVGQFITSFSAFLGIYFLMTKFNTAAGFSFNEIILCFSIVLVSFSLAECFARGFDCFSSVIGNGEFDRMLIRPESPAFQVLCSKIELSRGGRLLQAILMFAIAVKSGCVRWTAGKVILILTSVACGSVLFSALFAVGAAVCFFSTQSLEVLNIFTDGGREFGRYPLSVYGKNALRFYTFVVPMALFQYYPFLYLTDRTDNLLYAFAPLFSLLFLIPVSVLWNIGLRHYKSTGS